MRIGDARDRLAGAEDLVERDQNSTSAPAPSASARRSTCSAAARSSTASPSDLNTVSSESERPAVDGAVQQLADLAADVLGPDRAVGEREEVVARLVDGRLAPVDVQRGGRHRRAVELARRRDARADGVHVRALGEPLAAQDRLARRRRGDDDVRAATRLLGGRRLLDAVELGRLAGRPAPDAHALERQHRAHRVEVRPRLDAGAEDRERARLRPGEQPRRDRRTPRRCGSR